MASAPASMAVTGLRHALLALCITLPWLVPFTTGPNAGMAQWLTSSLCLLLLVLGLCLGRSRMDPGDFARSVALAWLAAALLSSAIALLQYTGASAGWTPWIAHAGMAEAYANLRQRNQFATLTSIGLIALIFLAPRRGWLWAALILLACGNAASTSRTGAVQWVAIAALAMWWWRRGGAPHGAGIAWRALLAYGLAVVTLPWLLQAATGLSATGLLDRLAQRAGCESRLVLWANVLELITRAPWSGWGWEGLKLAHFLYPYQGERFCALLDNAHNLPLHLAVELGLPLAVLLMAGAAWWVWRRAPWAEAAPPRHMGWSVLAVMGLHSLLEYPLWYGPFQMAALLALALLWQPPVRLRPWMAGGTLIALAAWTWVAWDYARVTQLYLQPEDRLAAWREDTLAKVRNTRFFRDEMLFAEITTTPLNNDNAAELHRKSVALLRFSPEPRVVQVALDSAVLLGPQAMDTMRTVRERFAAVYPAEYDRWRAGCTGCAP